MTTTPNVPKRGRLGWAKHPVALTVLMGLGSIVVVVLALVAWLAIRDASAHAEVGQQIDQLKAEGLPHDNASLAEYYSQATDNRDVDQWLEVLNTLASHEFTESAKDIGPWRQIESRVPEASQPWPEEADTLGFLQQWAGLREQGKRLALQDRKVGLPIEFDSIYTELPLTQRMPELARLFQLDSQVAIRNRDSTAAREAILAIFGCSRSIEGQPLVVSQAVCLALDNIAIEELRYALQADVLATDDLKPILARLVQRPSLGTAWRTTIAGERGGTLPLFTEQRKYMSKASGKDDSFVVPWRSRDTLVFLEIMDQAANLPVDNLNQFYASTREFDQSLATRFQTKNSLARWDMILSSLLMPSMAKAGDVFIQREMLSRLAMLGIGVRMYEDERGALPESLDQLAQIGLDLPKLTPLGDKPFGFRNENQQVILWGFPPQLQTSTPAEPPGFDQPGFDHPGFDHPGFDHPSFDQPSFDQPSFDQPSFDQPSFDQPSGDQPASSHADYVPMRKWVWRFPRAGEASDSSEQ